MPKLDSVSLYRDLAGELIPVKRNIEYNNKINHIFLVPVTVSELKLYGSGLLTDSQIEFDMLINHIKSPKFTGDEFKYIKQDFVDLVIKDILFISGIDIDKSLKRNARTDEDEFGKSLRDFKSKKSESDMILFLHELGYTYFDYGRLTYNEINSLIEADNIKNKEMNSLLDSVKTKHTRR